MELLSPKKIKRQSFGVSFGMTSSFEYTDPTLGVTMTKSINILSMNNDTPNHVPAPKRPTDEQIKEYAAMQSLIKSCVDNAEDIKERLHQIVINRSVPKSEEERIELMKMDFMKLKQWFMDDVRASKIYKHFTKYNSTLKLKPFSKSFNTFILDRNKYTHGQLSFLSPRFEYLLEYIETPSQQKEYAYITVEILQSYNSFYTEVRKVISEYNIAHQKKKNT